MTKILKNIMGWLLLIAGVTIIAFSLYSSFNIFTGESKPPTLFKVEPKQKVKTISEKELPKQVEKVVEEKLKQMLPSNFTPRLLNLISWSILAGILIFGGSKISTLGIRLLK